MLNEEDEALLAVATSAGSPGHRRALARLVTLIESARPDHRARAEALLRAVLPRSGGALRLGVSGVPGAGKSTLIDALGRRALADGRQVAVLTVDPSSRISGGALLGDKTRMADLATCERAFVRPSPSRGVLGGVAERTRETLLLMEAAGYDLVIVETMGVGQSEANVADMVDVLMLLQLPHGGDELQAIKKGVVEWADLIVVNKADLDVDGATRARMQIEAALGLHATASRPWPTPVLQMSATHERDVAALWRRILEIEALSRKHGVLQGRRRSQALAWMWDRIEGGLRTAFRHDARVRRELPGLSSQVAEGTLMPSEAARQLLRCMGLTPDEDIRQPDAPPSDGPP